MFFRKRAPSTAQPAPPQEFLLIAPKTYNTSHAGYDANVVRNHPGRITGVRPDNDHPVLAEILALGDGSTHVMPDRWAATLAAMRAEIDSMTAARELFAERTALETHLQTLSRRYGGDYRPGWVNVDDGLFLYWLVRRLRPKTIVQTGVCNGFSAALILLALQKNDDDGRLHAIDLPQILDTSEPYWTQRGYLYGVTIPEGRSSGWLVPASCRSLMDLQIGNAAALLPPLLDRLGSIDLFFHDSNHEYEHMAFEFREARRVLRPGGVIVADDIAWNSSLWDAADEWGVPAYNYAGSMGVVFR